MCNYHETAGLKSASWGAAQIMGFNHQVCGYGSVQGFVLALAESEEKGDEAFIAFLVNNGLSDELREGDIEAITRRYNGPGQVKKYSAMIRRAYKRIKGKSHSGAGAREGMLRMGSKGYRVRALQERLNELGYRTGVDGDFGPATRRAVIQFQADNGIAVDGVVGKQTETALDKAVAITEEVYCDPEAGEIAPAGRQADTVKDLRKRGSKTIRNADILKRGAEGAVATGVAVEALPEKKDAPAAIDGTLDQTVEKIEGFTGLLTRAREALDPVLTFASDNWLVFVILGGVAVWWGAQRIQARRLSDHKGWRHVG